MDAERFDAVTRLLGSGTNRRRVLRGLAGGMIGATPALGAGFAAAGKSGPGEPCRRKRQCERGLTCQSKVCCALPGDICRGDPECCSGACDPAEALCLCPVTLEPVCGGKCCNPLTQVCHNDRCCKLDGVRCDRDGQCCSGDCKNGRCQGACPSDKPNFCPATAESPDGFCCPSSLSHCDTFIGCRSDPPPGSGEGPRDACVYQAIC